MSKLEPPISNTCQDINKYVKELEMALKHINGFRYCYEISELQYYVNTCEGAIESAISNFESIREDNSQLREWGQALSQTLSNIIDEVKEYE